MKKNWKKISAVVAILIIGILSMNFLGSSEKKSNKRDLVTEKRTVEIEKVVFDDISIVIDGNGTISPKKTLNFISEASGVVEFAKNNLKDGTYVEKDEIVLKIDSREVKNNLYSMRSDFLNTVAALLPELKVDEVSIYTKWYKYFENLTINNVIPDLPEISNNQEKIKVSTRNIFTKYYNVKNQEILLSKYIIKSPFDGFISSNGVIENSFVSRGQMLFTIDDIDNLEISVPLLVEQYNLIDFNTKPKVTIYPEGNLNEKLTGYIVRKETKFEKNSQTLNVYVEFSNSSLNPFFLPGNYVNVEIQGVLMQNSASIPRYLINDENYVYTMEDDKLNKRKVQILALQKDKALIAKTLPDNASLVTTILQKPLIGMEIQSVDDLNSVTDNNNIDTASIAASSNTSSN
jgi:membrane fusion protein (multidrug efflux system)